MYVFSEIVRSTEDWDGELLKKWREELGQSVQSFAKVAELSRASIRNVENGPELTGGERKRLTPKTIERLRNAFHKLAHKKDMDLIEATGSMPLPPPDLVKRHGKGLVGKTWHYFHWTRGSGGKQLLLRGEMQISQMGECCLEFKKSEEDEFDHSYEGAIRFEDRFDILITIDTFDTLAERMVIRLKHTVVSDKYMKGAWLGVDREGGICSGHSLLTSESISEDDALMHLSASENYWVKPKGSGEQEDIEVRREWLNDEVTSSIFNCSSNDTIRIFSTFYNERNRFYPTLLEKAELLKKNTGKKKAKQRLRIQLLLMDPVPPTMVNGRCHHRSDETSVNAQIRIRDQVRQYTQMAKDYSNVIDLDIRLYSTWTFGKFVQIGQKVIYYSIIFAHKSATKGPMFILNNPNLQLWNDMEMDFKTVFDGAIDAHERLDDFNKEPKISIT